MVYSLFIEHGFRRKPYRNYDEILIINKNHKTTQRKFEVLNDLEGEK